MMMQCEFYDWSYSEVTHRVRTLTGCVIVSWYQALFR